MKTTYNQVVPATSDVTAVFVSVTGEEVHRPIMCWLWRTVQGPAESTRTPPGQGGTPPGQGGTPPGQGTGQPVDSVVGMVLPTDDSVALEMVDQSSAGAFLSYQYPTQI